jgi:hypothetical protein
MKIRMGLFVALLFLYGTSVLALTQDAKVPFVGAGIFEGRSGTALGPSFYTEVSPDRWFGIYGLFAQSHISNYQTQGVNASLKDFSPEIGIAPHLWEMKRMRVGGFFQGGYTNCRITASYPDGYGGVVLYRQSDHEWLFTGGADFRVRVASMASVAVRAGKNFTGGLAASQGGGIYLNIGLVVNPVGFNHPVRYFKALKF